MANFIKFGQGIMDFLTHKLGGLNRVEYKISHEELEELALKNEDVLNVLEELNLTGQKNTVVEVLAKAKSNYEIASIQLKSRTQTFLEGGFSTSQGKAGEVHKYHFSTKDKLYSGANEGVERTRGLEYPLPPDEKIIELYNNGMSINDIALKFKTYAQKISKIIPKELMQNRKLEDDVIEQIIRKFKDGCSTAEIAQEFGIARTTVTRNIPQELKDKRKLERSNKVHHDVVELFKEGLDAKAISEKTGTTLATVQKHIRIYNKETNNVTEKTSKEEILELFNQGIHPKEIAKRLNITAPTVYYHLPKSVKPGHAKLSAEIREKILSLRESGISVKQIAKEFGLSERSVYNVLPNDMKAAKNSIPEDLSPIIIKMRKDGYLLEEIAQKLNIAIGTVKKRLPEELKTTVFIPKDLRLQILKMKNSGLTNEKIAQELNLDIVSINSVVLHAQKDIVQKLPKDIQAVIIEKFKSGSTVQEISEELNLSTKVVRQHLPKGKQHIKSVTPEIIEEIIKLRKEGLNYTQIGKKLGLSTNAVIKHTPQDLKIASAKISQETHDLIIELRRSGMSAKEIADKLKLDVSTVNRHLPEELKIGTAIDPERIEQLIAMRKSGKSIEEIQKALNISYNSVYKYLPPELKPGTLKMDEELRKQVIKMRLNGMPIEAISKELDVSSPVIYKNLPPELTSFITNIDNIDEQAFKQALIECNTQKEVCEKLHISLSSLKRLYQKHKILPRRQILGDFRESTTKRYEQFNNEELKERLINATTSLFDKFEQNTDLAATLDKVVDEILANDINYETREKLIKLIRNLDLSERNIVSEYGLLRSKELADLKFWADGSKKVEELKESFGYLLHDYLPQNGHLELAQLLEKIKISGLDDKNIEIIQNYIQKIINSENLSKDALEILETETYKQASKQIQKKAEKFSLAETGKINPVVAGKYIRSLMVLENPDAFKLAYPKEFITIIKNKGLSPDLSVKYLIKLEDYFSKVKDNNFILSDFLKKFDINDKNEKEIIKEFVIRTYTNNDSKIIARSSNSAKQEAIFSLKAKKAILQDLGFPKCIELLNDFESVMTDIVPPSGKSGIKYMKNRSEYEVKLADRSCRLFSSNKDLIFDIYSKEGLH